jgi:hypothetical protein
MSVVRLIASFVATSLFVLEPFPAMAQTQRSSDPAVRSIATRQGGQLRREQTRTTPALSTPPEIRWSVSPDGGNCPSPYKSLAGACVLSCLGGYEDRGSVCTSIRQ